MELGLVWGYWTAQPPKDFVELTKAAEDVGFDSVWTAESWGSDAFTPLTWLAAHTSKIRLGTAVVQLSARTPTATAMMAMTLDHLSNGRVVLGLGVSGPQVVEGWYGRPANKPLARTREYVEIIRRALRREGPLDFDGEFSPFRQEVYADQIAHRKEGFEVNPVVTFNITDDVEQALWPVKASLGFYIGGMGAKGQNYHTKLMARMGYEEEAYRIQDLFFEGKREEAIAAVPDAFADEISLVGPVGRIKERLEEWRKSPVTTLMISARTPEALKQAADLVHG
jgi:alkanesulfonate monooxygenase SsuD/methylene tetrahydromethanopterin reductase-like flavin-dependent oxidoreductase (luciferase family)